MADQRILSTERMVGAGHATLADTLNRLALIDHNTDGTHKSTAVVLAAEKGAINGVATLDASGLVPDAQIPAAIARDAEVTTAITTHEAAADPHTGYQKESEKGVASGYASLGTDTIVPTAQLGTGTADATKFLRGDKLWGVPTGGATDKDIHYFRQIGTASPFERWYVAGMITQTYLTTGPIVANIMRAMPFISGRGGTLDRIAMNVSTGVAGNARIGIYNSTSDTNLYPNALIVDSGVIDVTTAAVKSVIISTVLDPNKLYWFVVLSDVAPTLRGMNAGSVGTFMGITSAIGGTMDMYLNVGLTYGALPATFPAGGGMSAGGVSPVIAVRYSA